MQKAHRLIPLFKNKGSSPTHSKTLILESTQTLIPNLKTHNLKFHSRNQNSNLRAQYILKH
jgi:hypothetical protein